MDKENMFVIDWLNEIIKDEDDWILFYSSSEVKLLAEKTLATLKEQEELLHKKQEDIDRLCSEISQLKHRLNDRKKPTLVWPVSPNRNTENRCVVCGSVIPEGRYVCPNCEAGDIQED